MGNGAKDEDRICDSELPLYGGNHSWSVWILEIWDSLNISINVGTTSACKELGLGPNHVRNLGPS